MNVEGYLSFHGRPLRDSELTSGISKDSVLEFHGKLLGGSQSKLTEYFDTFYDHAEDEEKAIVYDNSAVDITTFTDLHQTDHFHQQTLYEAFSIADSEVKTEMGEANTNKVLNILQWNCYHLSESKVQYLFEESSRLDIDVICLQEVSHPTFKKHPHRIPNFQPPLFYFPDQSKGLAIYIRNGISWKKIETVFE